MWPLSYPGQRLYAGRGFPNREVGFLVTELSSLIKGLFWLMLFLHGRQAWKSSALAWRALRETLLLEE